MVPAVVMLDVSPIMELGLRDVLRRAGIAVVEDPAAADAALYDLDRPGARRHADGLIAAHNGLAAIGCSSQQDEMLVLHRGGAADRTVLSALALRTAVRRAAAARERG